MGLKDINNVINGKIDNTDLPEINNINTLKLYNQRNDLFELKSILEIEFQLKDSNEIVLLKCIDVNNVKINTDINYEFDLYLEVINNHKKGYEAAQKYQIRDYEFDRINFYCREIEIVIYE